MNFLLGTGSTPESSFKIDVQDFHALATRQASSPKKSGFLVKQGSFNTSSWKRRWFEVAAHFPILYYYEAKGGRAIGAIVSRRRPSERSFDRSSETSRDALANRRC